MVIAYLRVSVAGLQDTDNQRLGLLELAQKHQLHIDEWVSEDISGKVSYKKRKLGEVIERLQKDDCLLIAEVSRLGRSTYDILSALNELLQKGVRVLSARENVEYGDNLTSKVTTFALALLADLEHTMISSRTKAALRHRRDVLGLPVGRPKGTTTNRSILDGNEDLVRDLLAKKISKADICRILGKDGKVIHMQTLDRFIQIRKIAAR